VGARLLVSPPGGFIIRFLRCFSPRWGRGGRPSNESYSTTYPRPPQIEISPEIPAICEVPQSRSLQYRRNSQATHGARLFGPSGIASP